ncbi:MAG: hypothetical protein MRJ65_07655 [Candidatus Brocadiaceae bacterium]|nr:hypothetical protein [Candidatus Brocadiaceae bacterium]
MIVNIYTLITLFLALVSHSLGWFLFYYTIKTVRSFTVFESAEKRNTFEQKGYLIFLIACVVLSIRMFSWPWFYLMLQSLVPEVPGAMCMFGVTRILPTTVLFLQIIKPISFFFIGGWLLCYYIDKSIPTTPFKRKILYYLLPICVLLLVDSSMEISYVLRMKPMISVSCCATYFDVPLRPSAMIPQSLFGKHYQKTLYVLYYFTNIILIIFLALTLSKKGMISYRKYLYYGLAMIAILNIPIVIFAFSEIIAPRLMQLPYHHCLYCFIGNGIVPDAPIIFGLFILGTFAIGWMGILRFVCRNTKSQTVTNLVFVKIINLSFFCFLASLLMVTIHLFLT